MRITAERAGWSTRAERRRVGRTTLIAAAIAAWGATGLYLLQGYLEQTARARIANALQTVTHLIRPGRTGFATIWDGVTSLQCRRTLEDDFRCEATSSRRLRWHDDMGLPDYLDRLARLGWRREPRFGGFVRGYPAGVPADVIAEHLLRTLTEVYDARLLSIEIASAWIADLPCSPSHSPTTELVGRLTTASALAAATPTARCTPPLPPLPAGRDVIDVRQS